MLSIVTLCATAMQMPMLTFYAFWPSCLEQDTGYKTAPVNAYSAFVKPWEGPETAILARHSDASLTDLPDLVAMHQSMGATLASIL